MEQRISALANTLSVHCLSCQALCCRTGRIALQPRDEPHFVRKVTQANGLVVVDLKGGCEHLRDGRCAIYAQRPEICGSFPLFLRYRTLFVAQACPAVKNGVLDAELESLKKDFPELKIVRQ